MRSRFPLERPRFFREEEAAPISPDSGVADLSCGMVLQQWHGKGA